MKRIGRAAVALMLLAVGFFGLYEWIEQPSSQVFGATLVQGSGHVVALTFDDGPNPVVTPHLLDVLEHEGVRATFFVVGRAAHAHPQLLRRMRHDGDEIGNHTETHAHLNALFTPGALAHQIDAAAAAIESATGERPKYLRPPFGARDRAAIDAAHARGYTVVMWSAMLGDLATPHPANVELASDLVAQVRDGAIVVLHDGDQGRDGLGGRTYEAALAPLVIDALKARGYRFVTISALHAHA